MRISSIGPFPPYRGGISDFNSTLIEELNGSNDVQIINYSKLYPNILFPGKSQFKVDNSNILPSERCISTINPFTWKKTAKKIQHFQPDIVLIHYWMPFFVPALRNISKMIKKRSSAQIIAICHNLTPHENQIFSWRLTKSFLKKVDRFMVMSESVKADLLKMIPAAIYKLTPHPIYDIFGESIDKEQARKSLNIKAKNVILFFGLVREYKGLDILLESIPLINNKLDDYLVLIAGECYEDKQKYYDIIDKLKIKDLVTTNFQFIPDEEVKIFFSAADVVALPYRFATQSGITQIAYNFNRPVIVSYVGGLFEIVLNGKTGYVVNPLAGDFSEAIVNFFNENKFDEFSKNIQTHKKQFSWSTFVSKLMELINS